MRRIIVAATLAAGSTGGLLLALAPAAHADGQLCVAANVNVAGQQLVNQGQCYSAPALPTPPALP